MKTDVRAKVPHVNNIYYMLEVPSLPLSSTSRAHSNTCTCRHSQINKLQVSFPNGGLRRQRLKLPKWQMSIAGKRHALAHPPRQRCPPFLIDSPSVQSIKRFLEIREGQRSNYLGIFFLSIGCGGGGGRVGGIKSKYLICGVPGKVVLRECCSLCETLCTWKGNVLQKKSSSIFFKQIYIHCTCTFCSK